MNSAKSADKITIKEFSKQVAMRNVEKVQIKGYNGQQYDFTNMRKVFMSQNRN